MVVLPGRLTTSCSGLFRLCLFGRPPVGSAQKWLPLLKITSPLAALVRSVTNGLLLLWNPSLVLSGRRFPTVCI